MRVIEALALARERGVARLDAQLLLAHGLRRPRAWLLAHDDAEVGPDFATALEQRAAGVPLAYVLGEHMFHGLRLRVTPAVLIPRPETEGLVDWAIEWLGAASPAAVADLGTGSGAIALALKRHCPAVTVTATDASHAALAVARGNSAELGLAVEFAAGDWWQPLAGRCFDGVVSNPPYIAGSDQHLQALTYEPRRALTPEGDGLAALRCIIDGAPPHLRPNGWLLLEHGHDQGAAVTGMLLDAGFDAPVTRVDLAGLPRCTGARHPGRRA